MKLLFPMLLLAALAGQQPQNSVPDVLPPETKAPPPVAQAEDASGQKAKAVIQQALQALGGQAYLGVRDMAQQGRTYGFSHGETAGVGAPFWRFWKWPDKERLELTKERDWIIEYNGDKGYEITFRGVGDLEAEQLADYLRRRQYSLENVLRRWVNESGMAFFYEGASVANGHPAEKVTLINTRNEAVTLYFDAESHLPLRKTFSWRDKDREKNEEAEWWDNYRSVQGIMTPFSITRSKNGDTQNQRFLTSVTYNQNLPDSMFIPAPLAQQGKKK